MSTRPRRRRVLLATVTITGLAVGLAAAIAGLAHATIGTWSPLPTVWPWQWSPSAVGRWLSRDAGSTDVVPVAVRVLCTTAWILLAVITWNLARELWFQARHGVAPTAVTYRRLLPSVPAPAVRNPARRHSFAASFVALLLGAAPIPMHVGTALPARPAAITTLVASILDATAVDDLSTPAPPPVSAPPALPAGLHWISYRVAGSNESLRSIAETVSGDPGLARVIWDANTGRDVALDTRLTDPAVVRAGWTLLVPAPGAPAGAHLVEVQPGDTLWGLIGSVVDTPTRDDVTAVARANDHVTAPDGVHTFHANHPDLINPGQHFDLTPAIALHNPTTAETPEARDAGSLVNAPAVPAPPAPAASAPAPSRPTPVPEPSTVPAAPETTTPNVAPPVPWPSPDPSIQPPTTSAAPVTPPHRPDRSEHDTPRADRLLEGLAGAVVLASGLTVVIRRQRRRRAARGASLARRPRGRAAQIATAIITAGDVPLVRWAGQEIAHLVASLHPADMTGAPVAIELSTHGIELLWDAPNPHAPGPWEAADGGWAWRCLYDPDQPVPTDELSSPIPALVTIGQRDDRQLLVDLERLGSLAVDGDPDAVDAFIRHVVLELGTGDDVANAWIRTVGVGVDGVEHLQRVTVTTIDETLAYLHATVRDVTNTLGSWPGTFQARCGTVHPAEATVVVVAGDTDPIQLAELIAAAPPRRGVALVIAGPGPAAGCFTISADGTGLLDGLGGPPVRVIAAGIPRATASDIAVFLDAEHDEPDPTGSGQLFDPAGLDDTTQANSDEHASPTAIENGDGEHTSTDHPEGDQHTVAQPTDETDDVDLDAIGRHLDTDEPYDDWTYPQPGLLVRVLGTPAVPDRPQLAKRRTALGLVVFLACHAKPVPRDKVSGAVWGGELRTAKTLNNTVYEARAALGTWPDGTVILPPVDQHTGTLTLHPDVMTDLAIVQSLVQRAHTVSTSQAISLLRDALALVDGEPFDAAGYEWAEAGQHVADARQAIEAAARLLYEVACDANDPATARYALLQGHKGLPANEVITRLRMQLEHRLGNTSGVHQVWTELDRQLRVIDAEPSTETTSLYRQLVRTNPAARQ